MFLTRACGIFGGVILTKALMRVQALPSGDLEMLLQQHPMMSGMGRAPSFGMGKLESMELPDAVAAVVRAISQFCCSLVTQSRFKCWQGPEHVHALQP